jgi:F0F1-type ATP synthase gamma subunit
MERDFEYFAKAWNLRYLDSMDKFSSDRFSSEGFDILVKIVDDYPDVNSKVCTLVGNCFVGNLAYNMLAKELLESKKIQTKCQRITSTWDKAFIEEFNLMQMDMLLFDNLNFDIYNAEQKNNLSVFVDDLYPYCGMMFFNIPSREILKSAPQSLIDLIDNSTIIGIK